MPQNSSGLLIVLTRCQRVLLAAQRGPELRSEISIPVAQLLSWPFVRAHPPFRGVLSSRGQRAWGVERGAEGRIAKSTLLLQTYNLGWYPIRPSSPPTLLSC